MHHQVKKKTQGKYLGVEAQVNEEWGLFVLECVQSRMFLKGGLGDAEDHRFEMDVLIHPGRLTSDF